MVHREACEQAFSQGLRQAYLGHPFVATSSACSFQSSVSPQRPGRAADLRQRSFGAEVDVLRPKAQGCEWLLRLKTHHSGLRMDSGARVSGGSC